MKNTFAYANEAEFRRNRRGPRGSNQVGIQMPILTLAGASLCAGSGYFSHGWGFSLVPAGPDF